MSYVIPTTTKLWSTTTILSSRRSTLRKVRFQWLADIRSCSYTPTPIHCISTIFPSTCTFSPSIWANLSKYPVPSTLLAKHELLSATYQQYTFVSTTRPVSSTTSRHNLPTTARTSPITRPGSLFSDTWWAIWFPGTVWCTSSTWRIRIDSRNEHCCIERVDDRWWRGEWQQEATLQKSAAWIQGEEERYTSEDGTVLSLQTAWCVVIRRSNQRINKHHGSQN